MNMKWLLFLCSAAFALGACAGTSTSNHKQIRQKVMAKKTSGKLKQKQMFITLKDKNGKKKGIARLMQTSEGVKITVEAIGLKPGMHGMHIHEIGKCVPPSFKSAGEHYNPFGKEHGFKNPKGPHAGDLPNVKADQNGNVQTTVFDQLVTLEKGKKNSLLDKNGSALIIHAGKDDYYSQPSGNSGSRVLCGKITS